MSEKKDTTILLLTQFGISEEESEVYLEILQGRGDTALKISRSINISRTKVYRLLDNLISRGLVITRLGERGARFTVVAPDQLEFLISDKEHELDKLKSTLPSLQLQLSKLASPHDSAQNQVRYYHGIEGLKQVTYNSLKAQSELLTFELSTMNAFMNQKEAEKLRERFVQNKIKIRTITNSTQLDAWTNVITMVKEYWEIRHLPPTDKQFKFEILIYNDIYAMYRYVEGEIFCVEIQSQELADMQRQLFEYLWISAKKFTVLNSGGAAKLAKV